MKQQDKKILRLTWIPYVIILFEMLYMATPFAIFFYGAYKLPLDLLASGKYTAWLVQTVFPHFTRSSNIIISIFQSLSVPFMSVGFAVFLIGFIQIYYAKFMKKGTVTGGLYRFIRHPQYAAWTLFGLGMSIIWSRLIVWLMFITMTFIYYFLARAEEKECLEKYPDTYKPYYVKTGMFFPKILSGFSMPRILPEKGIKRFAMLLCIYLLACSVILFAGINLRKNIINSFSSASGKYFFSLSLTEMREDKIRQVAEFVLSNIKIQSVINSRIKKSSKLLIYIIPEEWSISELGVENKFLNPMENVQTHGNPEEKNPDIKKVLISEPLMYKYTNDAKRILEYSVRQRAILMAKVDIRSNEITQLVTDGLKSKYGEIPVPLY